MSKLNLNEIDQEEDLVLDQIFFFKTLTMVGSWVQLKDPEQLSAEHTNIENRARDS